MDNVHEGCECAECGQIIQNEEDGQSSYIGSIHRWCATEENS